MRPAHRLTRHMRQASASSSLPRRTRIFFGAPLCDSAQLSWPAARQALTAFTSSSNEAGSSTYVAHAAGICVFCSRAQNAYILSLYAAYARVPCAERVWEPGYGREGGDSSNLSSSFLLFLNPMNGNSKFTKDFPSLSNPRKP